MAKDALGETYTRKVVVMKQDGKKGLIVFSNVQKFWEYVEKNFSHYQRIDNRFATFQMYYEIGSYSTFMKYFRRTNYLQLIVRNSMRMETKITVGQFDVK